MANSQLQHDEAGFIIGTTVQDIRRSNDLLEGIRSDIHAIRQGMAGFNNRTASSIQRNEAVISVPPNRSSGNVVALPMRGNTGLEAPITPRRDSVVTPMRGSNGRFVAGTRAENPSSSVTPGNVTPRNGGTALGSSNNAVINGIGNRVVTAISTARDGAERIDPSVQAASEVATPIMRGFSLLTGNGNRTETRWFRKIFTELRLFRKDETVFNRAANRSLHNIENNPTGGGDGGSGVLGFVGILLAGMFAKMFSKLPEVVQKSLKSFLPASVATVANASRVPGAAVPAVSRLAKVGKFLKKAPFLGTALTAYGAYSDIQANEANTELDRRGKDSANGEAIGSSTGGLAEASAGAALGAILGPGRILVGAILGYFGGSKIGEVIGEKVGDAFSDFRGSEGVGA